LAEEGRLMSVSKRLLALMSALVLAVLVLAGCGGGGGGSAESENKTLILGELVGWPENVAVDNVTKVILEEDFGYKEVQIETLDVGLLFEGVAGGDLDAFQDMWLPNHKELYAEVENEVVRVDPWYEGQTTFGLAVPAYMEGVNSIADLNESGAERIIGIEPGAVISEQVPDHVIPEYNLKLEYEPSSTAAMLAEVERLYNDKEPFVFPPWCPSPHCEEYKGQNPDIDYRYLEDPKNAMGNLDYGPQSDTSASISSIVNEDLPDDDPVAYAFIKNLKLNEDELIPLEQEIEKAESPAAGAKAWLKDNRDVVQPAIDAAKKAQ
jgi:glycine betaine/proline transport system substrate-binding protein